MPSVGDTLSGLNAASPQDRLAAVKALKDSVIGNSTKKLAVANAGAVPVLLGLITDQVDVAIQAVAAIGALCTSDPSLEVVLSCNPTGTLIQALTSHCTPFMTPGQDRTGAPFKLLEALVRTLKLLFNGTLAEGPRTELFSSPNALSTLVWLATPASPPIPTPIPELAAAVLGNAAQGRAEFQTAVLDASGLAALLEQLRSGNPKSSQAALEAMSALTLNNASVSAKLAEDPMAITIIMGSLKARRAPMRLLASRTISNLYHAQVLSESRRSEMASSVLPAIIKLCGDVEPWVRERAPLVLAHLIYDSPRMQNLATEADAVSRLAKLLGPVEAAGSPDGPNVKTRESALTALSAISFSSPAGRKAVVEAKVLPAVVSGLKSPSDGLRNAAAMVVRSLSRSVKELRTSLVDAGVAGPVLDLLDDPSPSVRVTATACVCNLLLDFSPMKSAVLKGGAIEKLVNSVESTQGGALRTNAVWALKNLTYAADASVRASVLKVMPMAKILSLASNVGDGDVREQALAILRNLVHGKGADPGELMSDELMSVVTAALSTPPCGPGDYAGVPTKSLGSQALAGGDRILVQALYIVCNLATGDEAVKERLMAGSVLSALRSCLKAHHPALRSAVIWCLINLSHADGGAPPTARLAQLKTAGFLDALMIALNDEDLDVRDRAKSAHAQFVVDSQRSEPSNTASDVTMVDAT